MWGNTLVKFKHGFITSFLKAIKCNSSAKNGALGYRPTAFSCPAPYPLKFRMLDYKKRIFVVEIWMQFNQNPEKNLKMHLNPHDKYVQRLLKLDAKTNMISFHFYDTGSQLLSSAITSFNDEETDWFDRNYKLSTNLISDQRGYKSIAEYLYNEISSTDRIFKYFNQNKSDFFVKEGGKQVMLHEISKLN